ncbi:hypothetical protein [Aureimonas sp. Leaf324]|jgi:hypothetical protein|uniref:hypothetical protein n=1 Tax=Aureimonas sp. Leaf324 TaxID=1736336 RepID=UPI0006FCCA1D|nr:hypothetical protein [Aureimonas sp. Leaf324]KQQ91375.1 hypothetical protein ASF65_02365 [Aureimonas sp. Leaf324]
MPEAPTILRIAGFGLLVLASTVLGGCRTDAAPLTAVGAPAPNAAEIRYIRDTGSAIYRRQPFERTRGFVAGVAASGYAVCLRAPMRDGRLDHTLLILQRRIEGAVSQVEDDATILRASADVGPCRNRSDWVPAR